MYKAVGISNNRKFKYFPEPWQSRWDAQKCIPCKKGGTGTLQRWHANVHDDMWKEENLLPDCTFCIHHPGWCSDEVLVSWCMASTPAVYFWNQSHFSHLLCLTSDECCVQSWDSNALKDPNGFWWQIWTMYCLIHEEGNLDTHVSEGKLSLKDLVWDVTILLVSVWCVCFVSLAAWKCNQLWPGCWDTYTVSPLSLLLLLVGLICLLR